jgi:hypothetical protein
MLYRMYQRDGKFFLKQQLLPGWWSDIKHDYGPVMFHTEADAMDYAKRLQTRVSPTILVREFEIP